MDQVPRFALYGEEARSTDAEFIHIEDIGSRSSRYDWEIASHTHKGLFQLVAMLDGGARVLIDDRVADLVAPSAVVVPPAVVHGFRFHPGTHGYVLTVAEAVLFDGAGPAGPCSRRCSWSPACWSWGATRRRRRASARCWTS